MAGQVEKKSSVKNKKQINYLNSAFQEQRGEHFKHIMNNTKLSTYNILESNIQDFQGKVSEYLETNTLLYKGSRQNPNDHAGSVKTKSDKTNMGCAQERNRIPQK